MFLKKTKLFSVLTGVFSFSLTLAMTGSYFANEYASMINKELGVSSSKVVDGDDVNEDTQYYKSSFLKSDGSRDDEALSAWQKTLCEQIQAEGTVLVENNGALPLTKGASVSCFGRSSADIIYGGTGSGQVDTANAATMLSAMKNAGFSVNEDLMDFYSAQIDEMKANKTNRSVANMWTEYNDVGSVTRIAEVPTETLKNSGISYSGYKDAAIVVIGRSGGEGADLATGEFADGNQYFELQDEEKALLKYVKSLGFNKTIVLINSSNAMSLDWLDDPDYGIDSCLWIGGPGQYGMNSVAKIISGDINPSGKFVDTYSASSLSSPAIQNFGGYTYSNADSTAGTVGGTIIDGVPGDKTAVRYAIHYLVEEEDIYVGYKYYETRYEDKVMNSGGAGSSIGSYLSSDSWDYTTEVNYAFGYGMSYTGFEQKLNSVTYDKASDQYIVSVSVKNTGSVAGKDTIEVYAQLPYTDFDKKTNIEKSSVQLVGFDKTDVLASGESKTYQINVDRSELKTYDSKVNKTYILEGGDYYFSIGSDVHDATNNILAKKGYSLSNGMDQAGDASNVYKFTMDSLDNTSYAFSDATSGYQITNQFDEANLNYYGSNLVTYLSRNNWSGTYPSSYDSLEATSRMINDLQFNYTAGSSTSDIVTGSTKTNYSITMMKDLDFDDETWNDLLDQLSLQEIAEIVGHSGYGTQAITSVSLGATISADGPQGIKGTYAGGNTIAYTSEPVMAATFNEDILSDIGKSMGEDALRISSGRVTGWYGPAMNIHRTPYSGRNFEYYSEDGFLSGKMAMNEIKSAQGKGLVAYAKHFALNDQETYRQSVATFATEQSIREIYLKPFQYAVEKGGTKAIMSSFNRIGCRWAGADKGLMTNVLRKEWGFKGQVLTDAVMTNRNWMDARIGLEAGNDTWLSSGDWLVEKIVAWCQEDSKCLANAREACHRFLYSFCNSSAINGLSSTSRVIKITPEWQVALISADIVLAVLSIGSFGLVILSTVLKKEKN